jgi:hypothetical protein
MNPRVVLTTDHPNNANDRMPKAADAARKLKWPALGHVLRGGLVLNRIWLRVYIDSSRNSAAASWSRLIARRV